MQPSQPTDLTESARDAQDTVAKITEALTANRASAIDVVYDKLDPLLLSARMDDARVMIRAIAENSLPLAIVLSALSVSYPWRVELGDARTELSQKARQLALEAGGEEKVREISRFL
jgi:hypothetical protein